MRISIALRTIAMTSSGLLRSCPGEAQHTPAAENWSEVFRAAGQDRGWKRRKVRFIRGPTGRDVLGTACA